MDTIQSLQIERLIQQFDTMNNNLRGIQAVMSTLTNEVRDLKNKTSTPPPTDTWGIQNQLISFNDKMEHLIATLEHMGESTDLIKAYQSMTLQKTKEEEKRIVENAIDDEFYSDDLPF